MSQNLNFAGKLNILRQKGIDRKHQTKLLRFVWSFFRALLFIGIGFVLLYPILYMVSIAFRPTAEITDPGIIWIPKTFTLENFPTVAKVMQFPGSLYNTLYVSIVSAVLQLVSCSMAGYGLARFKFKENKLLFGIVIFSIIVPMQTITIPTFLQFKDLGILNTEWVFFLPSMLGMGLKSGLYVFVFRQAFKGLPGELEQAALIDGCGPYQTFLRVIIPNSGGVYLTIFLFSFVWHWNDYYYSFSYMATKRTMATALATLRTSLQSAGVEVYDPFELVTRLQVGCLLMIVPLLLIYIVLQRYFVQGVERSGITGT